MYGVGDATSSLPQSFLDLLDLVDSDGDQGNSQGFGLEGRPSAVLTTNPRTTTPSLGLRTNVLGDEGEGGLWDGDHHRRSLASRSSVLPGFEIGIPGFLDTRIELPDARVELPETPPSAGFVYRPQQCDLEPNSSPWPPDKVDDNSCSSSVFKYPDLSASSRSSALTTTFQEGAEEVFENRVGLLDTPPATPDVCDVLGQSGRMNRAQLISLIRSRPRVRLGGVSTFALSDLGDLDLQDHLNVYDQVDGLNVSEQEDNHLSVFEQGDDLTVFESGDNMNMNVFEHEDSFNVFENRESIDVFGSEDNPNVLQPENHLNAPGEENMNVYDNEGELSSLQSLHITGCGEEDAFSSGTLHTNNRNTFGAASFLPGQNDPDPEPEPYSQRQEETLLAEGPSCGRDLDPDEDWSRADLDLDPRLREAWARSQGSGSLEPLLKEELRLKIMKKRVERGEEDLDVQTAQPAVYQMTEEDHARRDLRRAQNRGAARRFRLKKKEEESGMKKKLAENEKKNRRLSQELEVLRHEVSHLRSLLFQHRGCLQLPADVTPPDLPPLPTSDRPCQRPDSMDE